MNMNELKRNLARKNTSIVGNMLVYHQMRRSASVLSLCIQYREVCVMREHNLAQRLETGANRSGPGTCQGCPPSCLHVVCRTGL